jgi:hypothetical protein
MIIPKSEKEIRQIEIDLTGPDGNVFHLMGVAKTIGQLLNQRRGAEYLDIPALLTDMLSNDYEHAINVMEKNFGHMIIMYR